MDINRIQKLVKSKSSNIIDQLDGDQLQKFKTFISNNDVKEYLSQLISVDNYIASDINICGLQRLQDENLSEASPGVYVSTYGYFIIGTSIGGNAICVNINDGNVYWATTSNFCDDLISYEDKESGEWIEYEEYNDKNVKEAMILLSENFETFLIDLLNDRLTEKLEELD